MKKLLGCFLCVMLLVFGASSVGAGLIDLTSTGSSITTFQGTLDDDSLWRVIQGTPTGTGVYQPFLRYQDGKTDLGPKDGIEIGLNTDFKPVPYEDKMPVTLYTRAVLFSELGVVSYDSGTGPENYWSFTLDFNEAANGDRFLSFDKYDIYEGSTNLEKDVLDPTMNQLFYSNNTVLTDYTIANSGSGKDDIEFLIPVRSHTWDYMYLFIQSGAYPEFDDRDWSADAGFEEVRTSGIPSVPEPATMLLLGSGILGLALFGRQRFKK